MLAATSSLCWYKVLTGKFVQNSRTFQGLLKYFPTVFKDRKLTKNTDLHVKILFQNCISKDISLKKFVYIYGAHKFILIRVSKDSVNGKIQGLFKAL